MTVFVVAVGLSVITGGVVLRGRMPGRWNIPSWFAMLVIGGVLACAFGGGVMYTFGHRWGRQPIEPNDGKLLVVPGIAAPSLVAGGWLNGSPPKRLIGKVVVVDLWADWCPAVHGAAPGLVQVYQKYKDRNVEFIGLTTDDRATTERFVEEHAMDWPVGYNARETIDNLAGGPFAVFVVGRDGRVVWHDKWSRFRHRDESLQDDLQRAIEKALAPSRLETVRISAAPAA